MFRHIVVGADESPEAHDAVALGAALATATGSNLTLLTSLRNSATSSDRVVDHGLALSEAERRLRAECKRWAPEACIEVATASDAAQALSSYVSRCGADLVVVGSSRHAQTGRCAIGRIGRRLLDRTPAALAIAARGLSGRLPQLATIAVGYDGNPESEVALRLADDLASARDARLVIETIYEPDIPALILSESSPSQMVEEPHAIERRGALKVAGRAVARRSPKSQLRATVGDPGLELRRTSAGVDLMVIGSRRWVPGARLVLGGTGETLVSECGCSLLIARQAAALPGSDRGDRAAHVAVVHH